ncbi:hypothetical protein [Salipaludibacillus daqingensis]|uniref:hypothetical protein n=1 Tax=Salipaludibacillus daqingensis TaxID=3041001 RepID=UPI0024756C73|nr:hypothetical protein [Salipaludibacillus daqingensis]
MKKSVISFATFLFFIVLPFTIWYFQQNETFDVAIINKTAPDETYREHQSITWLLNHNHYVKNDGEKYVKEKDYYGFQPNEDDETYDVVPFPESFEGTDLIYIADTYGVYEEDLPWSDETQQTNQGPPNLIYGGLEIEEWQQVKESVAEQNTDLIMEFNSFASPTSPDVRDDITDFLRVDWQGWMGRHFNELNKESEEVPSWVITRYESYNNAWTFNGEGFVLINEYSEDIVVLSDEELDLNDTGIRLAFTDKGENEFGLTNSPAYQYWFDILEAHAEDDVLANYEWDLSTQGEKKLSENGIPTQFPAILHHKKDQANVYYFAGDFADIANVPRFYQVAGFATIRSLFSFESFTPETSFFWKTYSPMMEEIFAKASNKEVDAKTTAESFSIVNQAEHNSLSFPSRINGQQFEIYNDNEWEPFIFKGINMGMGKPGAFPGEAAIKREEYDRWFEQIGEVNANSIRIYTLHPPAFYDALYDYNQRADEPIYLLHGVWIDEEPLEETLDAFTPEVIKEFQSEMEKIVDVVHGQAVVDSEPGHASGTYNKDISPYVIGWVLGIEWYPFMVDQMEQDYPDLGDYKGDHVYTENANPMEHWMAEQFDHLMTYEMTEYSSMRPLSFTNWVTTDNLDQAAEPDEQEDMATVDPNHIKTIRDTDAVGMFASYHVYPYYPDFLNLEEKYTEFIDHRGEPNNYAGYLKDLNESHDMPILIAEFGIPASRGMTHKNPFGWNQGFISESEQGDILTRLYEDIVQQDMLGGMIFTWQDEWFKRTWNTMDYDNPDRRPFWSNAQTNEQQFGLLSFDRLKVHVNGENDWLDGQTLFEKQDGPMQTLRVDHDERYLYLQSTFDELSDRFWEQNRLELFFSVREDEGIEIPISNTSESIRADFRLTIDGESSANIEIAADYDSFSYDYPEQVALLSETDEKMDDKDTTFLPIRLALNREQVRPDTGEVIPFEDYETGELRFGIGDPSHTNYDSLADYYFSEETGILEIRIPWMLLNARDPSQKEFIGNFSEGGLESSIIIDGIDISASLTKDDEMIDSFQTKEKYVWENWDLPEYEERLKVSYKTIQRLFLSVDE